VFGAGTMIIDSDGTKAPAAQALGTGLPVCVHSILCCNDDLAAVEMSGFILQMPMHLSRINKPVNY